jgi:hypothetical protein
VFDPKQPQGAGFAPSMYMYTPSEVCAARTCGTMLMCGHLAARDVRDGWYDLQKGFLRRVGNSLPLCPV